MRLRLRVGKLMKEKGVSIKELAIVPISHQTRREGCTTVLQTVSICLFWIVWRKC